MSGDNTDARPNLHKDKSSPIPPTNVHITVPKYNELKDATFVYNMRHKKRGLCLIINNQEFYPSTGMNTRNGSDVDRDGLKKAFKHVGFSQEDIMVRDNLTCDQMMSLLRAAATEYDYSDSDCFVCCILSHGEKDILYGIDGEIPLDKLTEPFKGAQGLLGKPKLFFLQACRGDKLDSGGIVDDAGPEPESPKKFYRIATESDFLMAYSVVPGYYSWRNSRNGSWFVQALVDVMMRDGRRLEIHQILTRVNYLVSYSFESNAAQAYMTQKKQSPCIESRLTKELWFHK